MLHGGIRRRRLRVLIVVDVRSLAVHVFTQRCATFATIERASAAAYGECTICLEEGAVRRFRCGHMMHTECAERWFRISQTCPVCRTGVDCV